MSVAYDPAEPMMLRLARAGSLALLWLRNPANPALKAGVFDGKLRDLGLADFNPHGPGLSLGEGVEATARTLVNPDDCHP